MLRRLRPLLGTACLLAVVALLTAGAQHSPAQAGCITTLPVTYNVPSKYAKAYTKELTIYVHTKGPRITGLTASLSTFHGDALGSGKLHYALGGKGGTLKIRLKYPMQAGRYTLYFQGYPNRDPSCGPKHSARVLMLTGCSVGGLPVRLSNDVGGLAADYNSTYNFTIKSTSGEVLKNLDATLTTFGGRVIGEKRIPVLFGTLNISIPLRQAIEPQQYTLDVVGSVPGRPPACGVAQASATLRFN